MARMVRMTLEAAKARAAAPDGSRVDWALVHQTDEAEIRRQMIEDGEDPDAETAGARAVPSSATVRRKLGLTQPQFSALIRVPVATVRNWEQGRVVPDAAARALLVVLWQEPEAAVRALRVA